MREKSERSANLGESFIQSRRSVWMAAFAMAGLLASSGAAGAFTLSDEVKIHGNGGWKYGRINQGKHRGATEDGNYHNVELALDFHATVTEELSVRAQPFFRVAEKEGEVELDYAFASLRIHDLLIFEVGRLRHPFGNYAAIYDLYIIRPFYDLPFSVYGPRGVATEHLDGISFNGEWFGDNWGFRYSLYGGGADFEMDRHGIGHGEVGDHASEEGEEEGEEAEHLQDLVGVRTVFSTPMEEIAIGLDAWSASEEGSYRRNHSVISFSLEYRLSWLWLLGEYAFKYEKDTVEERTGYVELALEPFEDVLGAVRYENTQIDPDSGSGDDTLNNQALGFSASYWIKPEMVARLGYTILETERLVESSEAEEGQVESQTQYAFTVGVQFAF